MYLPILLSVCLCLSAHAAGNAKRTCRILFLGAPPDAPQTLQLFDGSIAREVQLTRMSFSPIYEISPGDISLTMLATPPANPKSLPAGAPRATVANSVTDFYLIVSSDPSNDVAPVKFQVVNADALSFKRGQMLWFNLTENRIAGLLGTRKLMMEPNSKVILDAPASKQEDYHVNIQYRPPGKERFEPICETNWLHDPRSRGVFFVLTENGGRIPRILGFPDFREMEQKATADSPP